MKIEVNKHEAASLWEAIEDRLEKDIITEQERDRLLKLRYRIESLHAVPYKYRVTRQPH
jgi:hypothetical protein